MYVTQHSNVTDRRVVDSLFELYTLAYGDIAVRDITREVLYRTEFDEIMSDPTFRTTVVRDDDDSPIAMCTFATDIGATHYLSRPYFEQRYPERLAAGAIHYVMWAVVHPDHQARRAVWHLARASLAAEAEEGTLLVFDLPESNQPRPDGFGAEFFRRLAASITDVELKSFGLQRYYALDFAPAQDGVGTETNESERVST